MKKLVFVAASLLISASALYAKPNDKLIHLFENTFPNAENVKWNDDVNGYVVCFKQSGILNKIMYDKDDNFISSVRYYGETNLPANILSAVKKRFYDKDVFGVAEFAGSEGVNYYIKLKDQKKWYTVKCNADADLQVIESYKIQQ